MRIYILFLLLSLLGGQQFSFAQFQSARLQATGLTCALCSKAIHESLEKLPFVQTVTADIKSSAFSIRFKESATLSPDELKTAVEDAGFFIGELLLEGKVEKELPTQSTPFQLGDNWYQVLTNKSGREKSAFTWSVVDKGFVTEKVFKKYLSQFEEPSLATGFFVSDTSHAVSKQRLIHVIPIK